LNQILNFLQNYVAQSDIFGSFLLTKELDILHSSLPFIVWIWESKARNKLLIGWFK